MDTMDTKQSSYSWYYPREISKDLDGIDIPLSIQHETLACAWEYTRCVIPHYTNWRRYISFVRLIIIATIAEFRGDLVDVTKGNSILNYDLDDLLTTVFGDSPSSTDMAKEFRTFCLMTRAKTNDGRQRELFRRYMNVLTASPKLWFRLRDCDALARFTMVAAWRCSDLETTFSDAQFEIVAEIADTLYDAIAFYKHRSEGEVHNTFAYMPQELRVEAFRRYREALWALDASWSGQPNLAIIANFTRVFGGPLHMMARRYRFVEDGLAVCLPESEATVEQTRRNFKLWNRLVIDDSEQKTLEVDRDLLSRDELWFPGFAGLLESHGDSMCGQCRYPEIYGVRTPFEFGGRKLCEECVSLWRDYLISFPERLQQAFPQLKL